MFFRLLATLVAADAIDRAARKPPKYWYPNHAQPCSNQFLRAAGQAEYPPSWYLDPAHAGGLRWWDGSQWTGHTARPIWPATKPE